MKNGDRHRPPWVCLSPHFILGCKSPLVAPGKFIFVDGEAGNVA